MTDSFTYRIRPWPLPTESAPFGDLELDTRGGDILPEDPLSNDRWVALENDIRTTLGVYGVDDGLWLVHDLLVAFRLCLTASNLVDWKTVRNYYRLFPDLLTIPDDQLSANPPLFS